MKRLFLIPLLITIITWAHAGDQRPFVWADDEDYWPAIYRGKDGEPAGIFNDILTELFARLNIPLEKAVYPWKRAQKLVKEGEADGMVTVYTKERQTFTVATDPIWYIGETLFFRRDNPKACEILKINSFDDMKNFIVVDTMGSGWVKEKYKEHGVDHVLWVPTVDSAFNMLAKGRADLYLMFDLDAYNLLMKKRAAKSPLSKEFWNIVAITPKFASLPFRLLIRKDSPFAKKIDEINRVIEQMKNDGTYQRIRMKYVGIAPIFDETQKIAQ